jgi:hypothetical protein
VLVGNNYSGNKLEYPRSCLSREGIIFMDRGRVVAIITGIISIAIAIAYLIVVQILDFRGEMLPAPIGFLGIWG